MWKNGKEGNTEGRRIMEGKDGRWKMEDGRRLKRKKKTEPRKRGGDAAGKGRGAAGTSSGKQSGRKQNNCGMA